MKTEQEYGKSASIKITRESGIPLMGHIAFGVIERSGNNIIQVRATTVCNMRCEFCSTSANDTKKHPVNYIVDIDYLVEWVKEVAKIKGDNLQIFLDSVGDPLTHPDFVELVAKLRKIPQISDIITVTNGTLLTKEKIDALEKAGLTRVNISIHSLDKERSRWLFGSKYYDIEKVIESIRYIAQTRIKVMLTPVLIHNINDNDVEEIIKLAKEIGCLIGIQNYEIYKYGRKIKKGKPVTYWNFYKQVKEWEKKYNLPLQVQKEMFGIEKRPKLKTDINVGERINVRILAEGWMKDQRIAAYKNRCLTINHCAAKVNDKVNAKITETKNNIILAEQV